MNEQILLAERPKGMPTKDTFKYEKIEIRAFFTSN